MSSTSPNPQAHNKNAVHDDLSRELREQLRADLSTFLDADVHLSGYIVAWICRNLPLGEIERLVDELDTIYRRGGRSILGREK